MNENRLVDYLGHMQQAAVDACGFIEGLDKVEFLETSVRNKPSL